MKLTYVIAARSRPQVLLQTLAKTLPHIRHPQTKVLICLDADDGPMLDVMLKVGIEEKSNVIVSVAPREDSRGEKYDRALRQAPADVYLCGVDHAAILTPGWDEQILEAASVWSDGIAVVYTPMANLSFPSLQAVTARLAGLMGHLYPPDYPFWFIDHHLDDIARLIDRISYADVAVDCHTLRPGKTIGCRDLTFWYAYFDAARLVRRRLAFSIIDQLDEKPGERAAQLKRNYPLVEHRSKWINDFGRANRESIMASRGEVGAPDERYLRIRARAEQVLMANIAELEAEAARLARAA